MAERAVQIPLAFAHRPAYSRDDFLTADSNRDALASIEAWPEWPGGTLILCGPEGSGKTHLAHIWRESSRARLVPARGIDPDTAGGAHLAIENVDDADDDVRLLHALNRAAAAGRHVLATARRPPGRWRSRLPDLVSRLRAAQTVGLGPPEDDLIAAVLEKLLRDRQLRPADGVIAYLVARMERSLSAAGRIVTAADALSLGEQRRVTVPLVRSLVDG